jgi:membrane-bound serine protease (ClpP class)
MKYTSFIVFALLTLALFSGESTALRAAPRVDVAVVNGMIGPVSEEFIREKHALALAAGSDLLVIQLDTPGGLLSTTREIVKLLLGSDLPVAVYVAPSGSRAGSAGVFITMAAHIAAMAPGTNIGAAHPVSVGIGGGGGNDSTNTMGEKVLNDTRAFIKTIASQRSRNVAWADSAVRHSVSITEQEALERQVIDLVAEDVEELVELLDEWPLVLSETDTLTLDLAGARIVTHVYNWRYQLLDRLGDPNIAYILFLAGLAGLYFELSNPGMIFPGVVGGISLILALFAFQTLPINMAAALLIVFAIVLFIMEIKIPSFGLLTVGGIVCLLMGSIMLYRGEISPTMPEISLSWQVLIPSVAAITLFFVFVIGKAVQSLRRKVTTGHEGLVGETGHTSSDLAPEGKVFVHGEIWLARSDSGPVATDTPVRVTGVDRLRLIVEPLER